ncbi:helix-turn-helix domain-containing protein [Litorimonas sp. RW-G-Af-16]|uniref:helix-turn-helix domain-containing protein n=1 Tax=Litorimonas sp. RW-G-Af-16 TaxID=3241168 RepID=UPI00390CB829
MRRSQSVPEDIPRALLTVAAVSLEFGLPDLSISGHRRGDTQHCFARQVAMYLLHVTYNVTLTRTAQLFSKDRSTVSHACNVVEDSRDDPVFDRKISKLESFLAQAPMRLEAELC